MEILKRVPTLHNILVSPDEEEDFCRRNRVHFKRLANGAILIGVSQLVEDNNYTHVEVNFPSGSYHDELGKSGLHHVFEHMGVQEIDREAKKYQAEGNAYTSAYEINFFVNGTANPSVKNYGVWPVLPVLKESLADPLGFYSNLEMDLERGKAVVYGEIREYEIGTSAHGLAVQKFWEETLFPPESPHRVNTFGTKDEIASISADDLLNLGKKILVPKGMIVAHFTSGKRSLANRVTQELEGLFTDFPRADQPSFPVDRIKSESFNPDFVMGRTYSQDTGLDNDVVDLGFAWLTDIPSGTVKRTALNRLIAEINNRMFLYQRQEGLGYSGKSDLMSLDSGAIAYLDLKVSSQFNDISSWQKLLKEIKAEVLASISESDCEAIIKQERLIQKAVPITRKELFDNIIHGLKTYGLMIDAYKSKRLYASVSAEDIWELRNYFLSTEPAIIAVGNLSPK